MWKKVPIRILVDSGSTHISLDPQTAKQVSYHIVPASSLMVIVADTIKVSTKAICPGFQWIVDGEEFTVDMRVLPLVGYNMILGVQWPKQVGPTTRNHIGGV